MRAVALAALLVSALGGTASGPSDWTVVDVQRVPGDCPLGHGPGIPVPEREQLGHCECEKWWTNHAPARLAFADCSKRERVEACDRIIDGDGPALIYVDIQLYRCPRCGMLFTEPE